MLALEDHIEKALKGQLTDLKDYPDVVTELREIHRQVEHHISDLRTLSDRRNAAGVAQAVKRAGSAVAGAAAGLIDLVRSEGLPKHFRDDADAILPFDTLVPASVVRYLQQEGLPATDVVSQVNRTVKEAWDQVAEAPAAERFTESRR